MNTDVYLLDANIFLDPSKNYYQFSIAPGYWKQLNDLAEKGLIKTIDLIEKELRPRDRENTKDDIQLWYENDFKGEVISTHQNDIIHEFKKINQHVHDSPKYNDNAWDEWFRRPDVADPWLIATAKTKGYIIVTFEVAKQYNGGTPMGQAKIPNVCDDVNVKYVNLFKMMKQLKIIL